MSVVVAFVVKETSESLNAVVDTIHRAKEVQYQLVNVRLKSYPKYSVDGMLVIISAEKLIEFPKWIDYLIACVIGVSLFMNWTTVLAFASLYCIAALVQSSLWLYYGFMLTLRKAGYKGPQKMISQEDALRWVVFGRA